MVSCDHQRTTQPHHIKDSLAYDIESIKIIPSNEIKESNNFVGYSHFVNIMR